MSKLTICIPAYDRPAFLREALDSLCDQGLRRDEYVVAISDDASPVMLSEVVREYDDKLQIVYKRNDKNIGHLRNFERAIELCQTPYFSVLPDDDLIAPGQLKRALSVIEKNENAVLVSSLILCQRHPAALGTSFHGIFLKGREKASYSSPYRWDQAEWMALALVYTPLSMIGSLFRTDVFRKCQLWKSFPLWHDRLMLAEMGLHGNVISLPWIGGYNRLSEHQLNTRLAKIHANEFTETSKLVLDLCRANEVPVVEFWIEQLCESPPDDVVMYLRMLHKALPPDVYGEIKRASEKKLNKKLHLGFRLDQWGIPKPLARILRLADHRLARWAR